MRRKLIHIDFHRALWLVLVFWTISINGLAQVDPKFVLTLDLGSRNPGCAPPSDITITVSITGEQPISFLTSEGGKIVELGALPFGKSVRISASNRCNSQATTVTPSFWRMFGDLLQRW